MKPGNAIFSSIGTSIFEAMSALARESDAINLGQGFPDGNGPDDVRAVAIEATERGPNQYPPASGTPELRQAVAAHDKRFYGLEVDWRREVQVTCGATEALGVCFLGLLQPGDEVVMFEPVFDTYVPMVRRAGGVPRLVRLEPPDWGVPRDSLAAAFGPKTKLLVLNSPMNPTGKVFGRDELDFIAELALRHDAYVVCDEVYEHLLYDDLAHVPLITLPGMRERCLRIGSGGKTFSLTGWKVGFIVAAPELLAPVSKAHQFLIFSSQPNLQRAIAYGLGKDDA
ncbi:MAG: aminotransferase class I/II-fold pyridoxal phosphate-dependent enzyme, partial [Alphaproteobacteria bacterium]